MFEHTNMLLNVNTQEEYETDLVQSQSIDFVCSICNCQYENEKQFYDHLHIHTGDVRWKYTQCSENNSEIKHHAKVHENFYENVARPFKCQQCNLTFDRASQLDYHRRSVHLGEKSQLCEICGKGFFRKTDLRTHLNIHLGTNLCICEVCGRKFNHISNQIRHSRMHAGVKPYPCSICGKRFTQISSLARHKRIHERSKESVKQQLQSNCINNVILEKDCPNSKNKFVEGNTPNHQKIVKRQHYCKICGESFSFIFLLRQHEKCHLESTATLECKNCSKSFQKITELKAHRCHVDTINETENEEKSWEGNIQICQVTNESDGNKEFCESETDAIKKASPLETIIYITSEQFKKINLEHIEDTKSHFIKEHLLEMDEKIETIETLNKATGLNVSEIPIFNDSMEVQSINDSHVVLYKSNDLKKEENVIYIRQLDKNSITVLEKSTFGKIESIRKTLDTYKSKNEEAVIDTEINLCPYKCNEAPIGEKAIHRPMQNESVFKSKSTDSELQKSDETQNCNTTLNIPENVNNMLQKMDLSSDSIVSEHIKSDLIAQKSQEVSSTQDERNSEGLLNTVNSITNHEEPMSRLVQTETGEQFYEFIINNLVEKLPNILSSKMSENKVDESTSISESIKSTCLSTKDVSEEIHHEQDLQDITDIHSDLNYMQYGLQGEEKAFITNQALLGNDIQADLDRYVEANFEVFERLNFENSSERFLEFVGISENTPETSTYKDSSVVRFVQNEGEQFLELLQDSQMADKSQSQDFDQIDHVQQKEIISDTNDDEQILLPCVKDDAHCEMNTNDSRSITNNEKQAQNGDVKCNEKEENAPQESKKSKIFLIKFQCTVCEKSFSTSYNYKQHIGTHFADQQKFHCKECKMSFAWKSTLNKHIANNHRQDRPQKFACEICSRVYNTLSQVNEHVKRDHLKQRNHICSHCGKSFFKKYDLKIHNRIHTDERPYVCRACGKRFHHRSHIIRHERIHF